ncbi:MAG: hypothetical protein HND52_15200 [Ignavibacteriae bacterium]|nr:hypothetical protein [Ignavibacteriota bacterium]NOG99302.1 hypothetical protein [Ignavibacteriota bacterium]
MKSDKYKVVRAIKELERNEVIHEYYDVLDYGVDLVLSWYGILGDWNDEEYKVLNEYLLKMAYNDELNEVVRITDEHFDPVLDSIPIKPTPSLKLLQLEHAIWKREMSKRREKIGVLKKFSNSV